MEIESNTMQHVRLCILMYHMEPDVPYLFLIFLIEKNINCNDKNFRKTFYP